MKNTLCAILMTLFIALTTTPCTFAQDYTRWGLPEDAKVRLGKGGINEIAYSPDGTKLAVASAIGIWIYNIQTTEELYLYTGHMGEVLSISFSPDGKTIASGGKDDTIHLLDVARDNISARYRGIRVGVLASRLARMETQSQVQLGQPFACGTHTMAPISARYRGIRVRSKASRLARMAPPSQLAVRTIPSVCGIWTRDNISARYRGIRRMSYAFRLVRMDA